MIIRVSSKFKKSYRKLPNRVKVEAKKKEKIFRKNPFDKRLGTHKLHGKYKNSYAFTVIGQWRIMFAFSSKDRVDFIDIGTHEIYR